MKWKTVSLRAIAPPKSADFQFSPDEMVWNLTLDQIEGNTGRITNKQMVRFAEAGSSSYTFDDGTVLYSKLRPYLNKVYRARERGVATTELVPMRPKPQILDPDYLAFYLRSNYFLPFATQCVAGVKMPRIIMEKFWQHEMPLPPLSEQRRIVEILEQADALRRLRTDADAQAARILPALFHQMFGDPATNSKKWPVGKLGDVIEETQYGTSEAANTSQRGAVVIRMNNIRSDGRLDLTDLKHVELPAAELEKCALAKGDLLFNRTNTKELVGKTGIWRDEMKAVLASYLIRVRVNREKAYPEFVWAYLNTPFMKQILFEKARRAIGMANINTTELRSFPAFFPDLDTQEKFCIALTEIDELEEHQNETAKDLEKLFATLLHRAFSGELTARWREAHLKELLAEMELQAKALKESESK